MGFLKSRRPRLQSQPPAHRSARACLSLKRSWHRSYHRSLSLPLSCSISPCLPYLCPFLSLSLSLVSSVAGRRRIWTCGTTSPELTMFRRKSNQSCRVLQYAPGVGPLVYFVRSPQALATPSLEPALCFFFLSPSYPLTQNYY